MQDDDNAYNKLDWSVSSTFCKENNTATIIRTNIMDQLDMLSWFTSFVVMPDVHRVCYINQAPKTCDIHVRSDWSAGSINLYFNLVFGN